MVAAGKGQCNRQVLLVLSEMRSNVLRSAVTFSIVAPFFIYAIAHGFAGTSIGASKNFLPAVYVAMLLAFVGVCIIWIREYTNKNHIDSGHLVNYIKDTKKIPFTP